MPKSLKNVLKLFLYALGCWFFFAVLTPFLEDHIPAWKRYNQIQEEQNLDSGALYYTNVPQVQEAEEQTRRAVREGMALRREALKRGKDAER